MYYVLIRLSVTSVVYLVVQSVVLVEFMKICTSFKVLCFVQLELSSFYGMLWTDSYEYVSFPVLHHFLGVSQGWSHDEVCGCPGTHKNLK
jgi:hypothetical protein